jgi:hypothetical protein
MTQLSHTDAPIVQISVPESRRAIANRRKSINLSIERDGVPEIPREATPRERDAAQVRLHLLESATVTTGIDFRFGGRRR